MFLYSKCKITKELILRIYDDGSDKRPVPVIVDEENKTSSIESIYEDIRDILKANNFIDESIEKIMTVVQEETKTVDVSFKTVNIHEGDVIDIKYISNGEIKEIKGRIHKIRQTPSRRIFRAGSTEDISNIELCLDTSTAYQHSLESVLLNEIRDINIIERDPVDPFGDKYPEYVEATPPEEPNPETPEEGENTGEDNPDTGEGEETGGETGDPNPDEGGTEENPDGNGSTEGGEETGTGEGDSNIEETPVEDTEHGASENENPPITDETIPDTTEKTDTPVDKDTTA